MRDEVEALLAMLERDYKPNNGVIAELCRTWLAVQDAQTYTAVACEHITACEVRIPLPFGHKVKVITPPADGGEDG